MAVTPMEEYFFDLRGFTIIPAALDKGELAELNGWIDAREEGLRAIMDPGSSFGGDEDGLRFAGVHVGEAGPTQLTVAEHGVHPLLDNVHVQSYYRNGKAGSHAAANIDDGVNLQHVWEYGEIFERLLDHPSYYPKVQHYLGDYAPFMHELFLNIRGEGGYIGCHGGGPRFDAGGDQVKSMWGAAIRSGENGSLPGVAREAQSGVGTSVGHDVQWMVPYLSMMIALEDIGPYVHRRFTWAFASWLQRFERICCCAGGTAPPSLSR